MERLEEAYFYTGVYRCSAPIENMKISVHLEQIIPWVVTDTGKEKKNTDALRIEKIFSWQEKKSKRKDSEGAKLDEINNSTYLDGIFFTYTSSDDGMELLKSLEPIENLGSHCGNNLPSLTKMRANRNKTFSSMTKKRIVNQYQSDVASSLKDVEYMIIMLDLSYFLPTDQCKDQMLVSFKYNRALKELSVYPDLKGDGSGYYLKPGGATGPNFAFWVSVLEEPVRRESHSFSPVELMMPLCIFEGVPEGDLDLTMFLTIKDFIHPQVKNVFVNYSIHLPEGWSTVNDQKLSGNTQSSFNRAVSVFQHTFEHTLSFTTMDKSLCISWPVIMFQMIGTEGYCWLSLPSQPGTFKYSLQACSPLHDTSYSVSSFFVGSSATRLFHLPSNLGSPENLGRFGFKTIAGGILNIELMIIHQWNKNIPQE